MAHHRAWAVDPVNEVGGESVGRKPHSYCSRSRGICREHALGLRTQHWEVEHGFALRVNGARMPH